MVGGRKDRASRAMIRCMHRSRETPDVPADRGPGVVLVVGSVNLDHSAYVPRLPRPGETVLADRARRGLGGKGANQAVAAARAGADVRLLGAVGDDDAGRRVLGDLRAAGVDVALVAERTGTDTGAAYVTVDDAGENVVVVASGANATVAPGEVGRAAGGGAAVVLTQGELAPDVVAAAARLAREAGARFVLALAPVVDLDPEVLAAADPLVVNEHEAGQLLGRRVADDVSAAAGAARQLVARGPRSVVVSVGADGAVAARRTGDGVHVWHQPAPDPPSRVVDATGAGDALTGVLAAGLAGGEVLEDALCRGVAAATLAVTRAGAAGSYPDADALGALLAVAPRARDLPGQDVPRGG